MFVLQEVIKEILKTQYTNSRNKITDEALEAITEILRVLVVETAIRAAKQAVQEKKTTVSLEHLENVLPQIVNAFCFVFFNKMICFLF